MASKSYGWDVRNIAKISPKMAKKQPFFDFFRFSQKLSIRFERNFLQIFYTILESYMCNGIKIVWLGCEKQPKLAQKWSKKGPFFDFRKKYLSRLLYRTCGSGLFWTINGPCVPCGFRAHLVFLFNVLLNSFWMMFSLTLAYFPPFQTILSKVSIRFHLCVMLI